jgi:hypothetical protein
LDVRICGVSRVRNEAAPEKGGVEGLHVEAGDDAEVGGTALESLPEVRVTVLVGIGDASGKMSVVNAI